MLKKIDRKYWVFFSLVLVFWLLIPKLFILYTPLFSGMFGPVDNLEGVFAPVNALFSGLAFAILVITIFLQQRDIDDGNEQSYKQSFESNFFQLLSIHTSNINMLKCSDTGFYGEGKIFKGRSVAKFLYKCLKSLYKIHKNCYVNDKRFVILKEKNINGLKNTMEKVSESNVKNKAKYMPYYFVFNLLAKEIISHCHRHIYQIIKYIDESKYDHCEKMFYIRILRAQFCNYEFVLLFYSSLLHRENKFKKLLEKYEFFHNLDKRLLFDEIHHQEYEETAYGSKGYEGNFITTDVFSIFDLSE